MPIHRGPRLTDLISRLAYQPIALQSNIYQAFPSAANPISIPQASTWTEIITAAQAPATPFTVFLSGRATSVTPDDNPRGFIELGIGAAGSEVAIAGTWYQDCTQGYYFFDPIPYISGGTRVALRMPSGVTPTFVSLITALLPPPRSSESILRLVPKYGIGHYYPGSSKLWNTAQGVAPAAGNTAAWTFGSWAQIYDSTQEANPTLLTQVTIRSADNSFEGQLELGYGGTDGAANAPSATFAQITAGYPQGGALYAHYFRLPVPILWPGSTRLAARLALQGAVADQFILGVSGIRLSYYP